MSLSIDFSSLTICELDDLSKKIEQAKIARQKLVPVNYGAWFCAIIGEQAICNLPEVTAESLGLQNVIKYATDIVKPSMLRLHSAVRGILSWNRPFIAIKIEVKDAHTDEYIGTVVEVIHRRFAPNKDGGPGQLGIETFVTGVSNLTDDDKRIHGLLYCAGGMNEQKLIAVRDLLAGKEVLSPVSGGNYKLKMVTSNIKGS